MNRIEKGISRRNMRHLFGAIEKNPAMPGEYVLWPYGRPVFTVAEAVAFAKRLRADLETAVRDIDAQYRRKTRAVQD